MQVTRTKLPGLVIIEPKIYPDPRGHFLETWQQSRYGETGIPANFVQDNLSSSSKGVLRGLHLQNPRGQGKLITVYRGEIYDVAVDVRVGSATFGQWIGVVLSEKNYRQFYLPPGFAHGFYTMSENALVHYKCTDYYDKASELTIRWDDPDLGIDWPASDNLVSEKDQQGQFLKEIPRDRLPTFQN